MIVLEDPWNKKNELLGCNSSLWCLHKNSFKVTKIFEKWSSGYAILAISIKIAHLEAESIRIESGKMLGIKISKFWIRH